MSYSAQEKLVIDRFIEKTRIAGGPKAGYTLRRVSIAYGRPDASELDSALDALVEKGLLKSSEAGDRFFLTADGAEHLSEL